MKECKIDLSKLEGQSRRDTSYAIQKKAFRLGYKWDNHIKRDVILGLAYLDSPYLLFLNNGVIAWCDKYNPLEESFPEISILDFMRLSELGEQTIIIDGKEIVLSEESYENLKKQLCGE